MNVTDLRGLRVFSLMSALRMGTVEDALLDPTCRYVAALVVREFGPGPRRLVPRRLVKRVGRNAVILAGTDDMPEELPPENAGRMVNLRTMLGLEVVSDYGNRVGRIRNAVIDPQTLTIERYVVDRSAMDRLWPGGQPYQVDASQTLSASKDVLIVSESVLEEEPAAAEQSLAGAVGGSRWVAPDTFNGPDGAETADTAMG